MLFRIAVWLLTVEKGETHSNIEMSASEIRGVSNSKWVVRSWFFLAAVLPWTLNKVSEWQKRIVYVALVAVGDVSSSISVNKYNLLLVALIA